MENANIDGAATRRLANAIRALSMDGVEAAKSGHPGMPMGMADAATVLYSRFLKFDRPRLDAALLAFVSHRLRLAA
jgi:transketolase